MNMNGIEAASSSASEGLRKWWVNNRAGLGKASRGLLVTDCPEPLPDSWWAGVTVWDPATDPEPPSGASVVVLPWINTDSRTSTWIIRVALQRSILARKCRLAILASTSLSLDQFKGFDKTEVAPPLLDVDELLLPSELAYYLTASCVVGKYCGAPSQFGESSLYLTPIERKMALALRQAGIEYSPQELVGPCVVDFLVDKWLVVECDGASFHDPVKDGKRDEFIAKQGLKTLRFSGREIVRDSDACIERIKTALQRKCRVPKSPPVGSYKLTPAQERAVKHGLGPALVAAPAGSGKTRVIEQRIRRLVAAGVDPRRICAISYINKAVDEMEGRLADIQGVTFRTLHGLANDICKEKIGPRLNLQGAAPGQRTRWDVIRPLLQGEEIRLQNARGLWADAIQEYRSGLVVPALGELKASKERFLEIHKAYDDTLTANRWTDFEGMVWDAMRICTADAVFRLQWSGKYDFWVVDEFQDMPLSKIKLLRLLVSPVRNLFAVGDDDQVILGFAGASPNTFLKFKESWPDVQLFSLDTNFRCPHELVVRTGWMIARNKNRVPKDVLPQRPVEAEPRVLIEETDDYDQKALEFIQSLVAAGSKLEEIALLFRAKDMAVPVEMALAKAGIPFLPCANKRNFFAQHVPQVVLAWLNIASGESVQGDWKEALKTPKRYLGNAAIDYLVAPPYPGGVSKAVEERIRFCALDASRVPKASEKTTVGMIQDALKSFLKIIEAVREAMPDPQKMIDRTGLLFALKGTPTPAELAEPTVAVAIMRRCASYFADLHQFKEWIASYQKETDYAPVERGDEEQPRVDSGKVLLSTIHKAKGKEFKAVAVLGPLAGMPDWRASTPEEVEEERRIAYVAATRAIEKLLFCCSKSYSAELRESASGRSWEEYLYIASREQYKKRYGDAGPQNKSSASLGHLEGAIWHKERREHYAALTYDEIVRLWETRDEVMRNIDELNILHYNYVRRRPQGNDEARS